MNVGVGEIEDAQGGFEILSVHEPIYATAFAEWWLKHLLWQASHVEIQFLGNLQHAVPHRFERKSLCIHRGKVEVLRVFGIQGEAGSSVGLGEKDFANERLDFPSILTKASGQIVKEHGMGGVITHQPEITGSADNSLAHQVGPNPIDHNPGGQGVVGRQNGFGQLQASASLE